MKGLCTNALGLLFSLYIHPAMVHLANKFMFYEIILGTLSQLYNFFISYGFTVLKIFGVFQT